MNSGAVSIVIIVSLFHVASTHEAPMRKLEFYVKKYGPDAGPRLYHALQSQAAHAGVSARLRRKIDVLTGRRLPETKAVAELPLFPEAAPTVPVEIPLGAVAC
jgi:hypothetical protein